MAAPPEPEAAPKEGGDGEGAPQPEPEPEPEVEPAEGDTPKDGGDGDGAEPEAPAVVHPEQELWRGPVETVKSEKKGKPVWQKAYGVVYGSVSFQTWNPRLEVFASEKAEGKEDAVADRTFSLADVEVGEPEPEKKADVLALAGAREMDSVRRVLAELQPEPEPEPEAEPEAEPEPEPEPEPEHTI